jgi:universal stress protein A
MAQNRPTEGSPPVAQHKIMKLKPATTFESRRIFVPVDFSDPSRQALSAAVALARRFGSRLAVAHVTRGNRPDSHIVAEQLGFTFDTRRAGRAKLAEFLERELTPGLQPTRIVADGVPFNEITKAAATWEADLIVIASHGYTGLKQVLLGSTTERVVRHASCPVLVVRGGEKPGAVTAFSPDRMRSILVRGSMMRNSSFFTSSNPFMRTSSLTPARRNARPARARTNFWRN